jgi:hypothetical protein
VNWPEAHAAPLVAPAGDCAIVSAGMLTGVTPFAPARHSRCSFLAFLSILALCAGAAVTSQAPTAVTLDQLRQGFVEPPPDSRIMMRWWWFGPAVTKSELERELRVMRDGGIGGVEIQPVYPLTPDDTSRGIRNLPFLSEEFNDALRFAADTARQLGLRADLTVGSGWPYGGPQVSIDHAAAKLRVERVSVLAGSGTARVPSLSTGERMIAAFLSSGRDGGQWAELTGIREGMLAVPGDAPSPREVLFLIESRTGQMVKRAAVGAEGYVLDHFSAPSLSAYLKSVGDPLLRAFGPTPPYAVFCDSLEVYDSDWASDFLEEFKRRRGYDLRPLLPQLVAASPDLKVGPTSRSAPAPNVNVGPTPGPAGTTGDGATSPVGTTLRSGATEALRNDWGRTLTELLDERFLAPMQQWARQHGTRFRVQGYGTPPATLSSNAYADLPEGEGAQWKSLSSTRWATSASHIYGVPVTSSETWTWLHSPVFRATPLDMKAEADLHFLQGINQLIGHGWPYTAEGVDYPGWRFYAAAVFDEKNPWWIVMPDITRYLQRLSFLLRQGSPANDVAIYLPDDDAWAHMQMGRVNLIEGLRARLGPDIVARVLEAGLGVDFFDDTVLAAKGKVGAGGRLQLGPNEYRAVILPGVERMPLATYRTLQEFARGGGVLIATRRVPDLAPGFMATAADHDQVRTLSQQLFRGGSGNARLVEDEAGQLGTVLTGLVPPDLTLSPVSPSIGFIHRRSGDVDVYFLANTGNTPYSGGATFRVSEGGAEWWDAMSGATAPAVIRPSARGAAVALELEPYESRVIVFSKVASRSPRGVPSARVSPTVRSAATTTIDVSTGWTVTFEPGGARATMGQLRSWTDDPATRYFSGVATYEREIALTPDLKVGLTTADFKAGRADGTRIRLDFGQGTPVAPQPLRSGMRAWLEGPVREAAVVYVNDQTAGSVWCPPYSIDVTRLLRTGSNRLRVRVANLAVNYMAGRALPDYRLLNLRYGVRFEAQDMDKIQPVPAGLLGPIRLTVTRN